MMGLEEHLLGMFRDDFEFHDDHGPSHLGHRTAASTPHAGKGQEQQAQQASPPMTVHSQQPANEPSWELEAEDELKKIPFFVRGRARRNTEQFARSQGLSRITIKTLYDAKAHFSR